MSAISTTEYLSIGGNRHSAASAWSRHSNSLAFGAGQNIAIWYPLDASRIGINEILQGHLGDVTAIAFSKPTAEKEFLVSGAADGQLHLWQHGQQHQSTWSAISVQQAHAGAVNCIACYDLSQIIVTGGSDAQFKVWAAAPAGISLRISVAIKPKFIPLSVALGPFPDTSPSQSMFLAASGTRNEVYVYSLEDLETGVRVTQQASLSGHEGWVHSVSLKQVHKTEILLASASHDKYVRLWRLSSVASQNKSINGDQGATLLTDQALSAKAKFVSAGSAGWTITFDALLLGHEDWVYTAAWAPWVDAQQLVTASADGSLAFWEPDPSSGIWISAYKLGGLSAQKGSTTATGSTGGFWTGLWSPDGGAVACLGRNGSWRLWKYNQHNSFWNQVSAISGHIASVNDLAWSLSGEYLLTTSADQTTRLHAQSWSIAEQPSWHEFARPQIHGYDLNCISATDKHLFVTGAEEKLLRVFKEPREIADMLSRLCNIRQPDVSDLADAAAMPVLGLSNKTVEEDDNDGEEGDSMTTGLSLSLISAPPTEEVLSRHTLWPEHEKLYGHGYEISACAFAPTLSVLATACKASSTDHAVIRLYDTQNWDEMKPALSAHSLTVTRLAFSPVDNRLLLSVGRDRQWAVFECSEADASTWKLVQANPKAHTRMILDADWASPDAGCVFATAGRDKCIKLWRDPSPLVPSGGATRFEEILTIRQESAVTAISILSAADSNGMILAAGEESGLISIHHLTLNESPALKRSVNLVAAHCPGKSVCRLSWRPRQRQHEREEPLNSGRLAVGASDGSLRILRIDL